MYIVWIQIKIKIYIINACFNTSVTMPVFFLFQCQTLFPVPTATLELSSWLCTNSSKNQQIHNTVYTLSWMCFYSLASKHSIHTDRNRCGSQIVTFHKHLSTCLLPWYQPVMLPVCHLPVQNHSAAQLQKLQGSFILPRFKKKKNLFKTQFLLNGSTLRRLLCQEQWVRTSEALSEREQFQLCYFPVHPPANMWWRPPQGPCWNAFVLFSLIVAIMCTVRCLEPQVVKMPQGIKTGRKIKHEIFSISGASPGTLTASAVQTGFNRTEIGPRTTIKLWLVSDESPNVLLFDGSEDALFVIRGSLCLYN